MNFEDITSYSKGDKERRPRVLRCELTSHISFLVHKHIGYGESWLLTSECVGLDKFELKAEDLEIAKNEAVQIMAKRLQSKIDEFNTAMTELMK